MSRRRREIRLRRLRDRGNEDVPVLGVHGKESGFGKGFIAGHTDRYPMLEFHIPGQRI